MKDTTTRSRALDSSRRRTNRVIYGPETGSKQSPTLGARSTVLSTRPRLLYVLSAPMTIRCAPQGRHGRHVLAISLCAGRTSRRWTNLSPRPVPVYMSRRAPTVRPPSWTSRSLIPDGRLRLSATSHRFSSLSSRSGTRRERGWLLTQLTSGSHESSVMRNEDDAPLKLSQINRVGWIPTG